MIKKYLSAVTLAFMIIFAGSHGNVAEAKEIYIGTCSSNWLEALQHKDVYLLDDSVRCNSYSVNNSMFIECTTNVTDFGKLYFTFRRVSPKRWVFMYHIRGYGGGGDSGVLDVDWNDVDGKLIKYILNNYE